MDPRWASLTERAWIYSGSGIRHVGLFDLVVDRPDAWPKDVVGIANTELRPAATILGENLATFRIELASVAPGGLRAIS